MSDEPQGRSLLVAAGAVISIMAAGYFIYRQSQPDLGNVPQINMSREELLRGAMVDGPGDAAAATPTGPDAPKIATPGKGGARP